MGPYWGFALGFAAPIVGVAVVLSSGLSPLKPMPSRVVPHELPALASVLPEPVAEAADDAVGCWIVEATESDIRATWLSPCPSLPVKKPGPFPLALGWPDEALILPAFHKGAPDFTRQKVVAELADDTATRGVGGLLYLPAAASGAGYYVAAYETQKGDAGWLLGTYGVPPVSVAAPVGRVYLEPGFKKKPVHRAREATPEAGAAPLDESPPMLTPAPSDSAVEKQGRPKALEFDN